MIELVTIREEHRPRFEALNRAWLEEHDLLEHSDVAQMRDPHAHFIAPGGAVFVALRAGEVVGTAAVVPYDSAGAWEIAKLAVDPVERGHGLGRRLVQRCITFAMEHGASRMVLVSNHQLVAAIRMYERMGFVHRPVPETGYATADVYMELEVLKGER